MSDALDSLAQDYVVFGLFKTPGKAEIHHAGSPRKWDKRAGYGTTGASLVFNGEDLATFDVVVSIWTETQKLDWDIFAAGSGVRKPPLGKRPSAIGIGHPLLNDPDIKISQVVVLDVTQWDLDEYGLWTRTIKCEAYRATLPALAKALPGIPAATAPVPTAQDAADVAIQSLQKAVETAAGAP